MRYFVFFIWCLIELVREKLVCPSNTFLLLPTGTFIRSQFKIYFIRIVLSGLSIRSTFQFEMITKNKEEGATSNFIGAAIYPTLAMFNHSCDPSIVR